MPRYATNDVILGSAVTVALAHCIKQDRQEWAERLANSYREYDDRNLAATFLRWSDSVSAAVGEGSDEWRYRQLLHLSELMLKSTPDGRRRRWKLFNGTRFNQESRPADDRDSSLFQDLARYIVQLKLRD